jgi:hypothetical protein
MLKRMLCVAGLAISISPLAWAGGSAIPVFDRNNPEAGESALRMLRLSAKLLYPQTGRCSKPMPNALARIPADKDTPIPRFDPDRGPRMAEMPSVMLPAAPCEEPAEAAQSWRPVPPERTPEQ